MAFGMEAFLNHIGEHLFTSWKEYLKTLSPEAKLKLIAEKIKLKTDFGMQPFQAIKTLSRFRNAMAHSSTEDITDDKAKHYLELGKCSWPAAEWEKLRTSKIAETILKDVINVISQIHKKAKIKPLPPDILSEFMQL
jgi:hypothetical protein